MEYRFISPPGDDFETEDPEVAVAPVLTEGADYWNNGAGGGVVEVGSEYDPLQLHVYYGGSDRFQLRYNPVEGAPLIAHAPSAPLSDEVVINVGGDPFRLDAGTLVPRPDAARIVRYFCETGEMSPDYDWS